MMRKYIFSAVCFLFAFCCHAQQKVLNADTIMAHVRSVLKSDSTREAELTVTRTKSGRTTNTNGQVAWKRHHLYISFADSLGNGSIELFTIEDTTWTYSAAENSVIITEATEKAKHTKTTLFHTGAGFDRPQLTGQNDSTAIITLFPVAKQTEYYKLVLHIDLRTYRETRIEIHKKDESVVAYTLKYTNINRTINPEVFLFDPKNYPAGLEINDDRK